MRSGRERAEAGVRGVVGEAVVDLVGDEVEVAAFGEPDERLQRSAGLHRAGRVRGRAEQHRLRARGDRGLHHRRVDGEPVLPAGRHPHRHPARERDARLVGDVAGLGDDHLVAGVEQHPQREVEPLGDAGGDQALVGPRVLGAVAGGQVGADQLAQLRQPRVGGVGGVPVLQRVDPGLAHPPRRDEVGLADAERDHVVPLGGDVEELPDPRRRAGGDHVVERLHGVTGSRWSGSGRRTRRRRACRS